MGFWTWAEVTIGIIVSCLPVMPRFFRHCAPKASKLISRMSILRLRGSISRPSKVEDARSDFERHLRESNAGNGQWNYVTPHEMKLESLKGARITEHPLTPDSESAA